jgi:hypothetical protein
LNFFGKCFLSLGKRISIKVSPFCGAGLKNLDATQPGHHNNLLYEVNWLLMTLDKTCSVGFSAVKSQGLEDTQLNFGELKYDYKDEIVSRGLHLG